MNTLKFGFRLLSVLMVFAISAFIISCNEESMIEYSDKQSVSSEANTDSFFEDAEDISATVSLAAEADLGGRSSGLDDRFCDNAKVRLLKKQNANSDTIIVDFGATGCTDPRGNVRKGKIVIIFTPGARFQIGNSVTTIFDGFSVNGIKIAGKRTVTLTSLNPPTHKIVLDDGKLTWPDNTFATREAQHFRKWDNKNTNLFTDDQMVIFGTNDFPAGASGVNRNGNEYTMQVVEDIVFKVECAILRKFMPASGEKILTVDGKAITVNYGSGDCDNTITVTINGVSQEVTVTRE